MVAWCTVAKLTQPYTRLILVHSFYFARKKISMWSISKSCKANHNKSFLRKIFLQNLFKEWKLDRHFKRFSASAEKQTMLLFLEIFSPTNFGFDEMQKENWITNSSSNGTLATPFRQFVPKLKHTCDKNV